MIYLKKNTLGATLIMSSLSFEWFFFFLKKNDNMIIKNKVDKIVIPKDFFFFFGISFLLLEPKH